MAKAERLSKDEIENLEISDLRDFLYGSVQSMIENNVPSGIVHHYLMPPVPFGPELASFMKLGKEPEPAEGTDETGKVIYTGNDMIRAAINFARLVDMVPVADPKKPGRPDEQKVIDLTQLQASGETISQQWEALLTPGNCLVVNNELSEKEKEIQQKLYNRLYKGPIDQPAEDEDPAPGSSSANEPAKSEEDAELDALLGGSEEEDDAFDIDALFSDGAEVGDFVADDKAVPEATKMKKAYDALAVFVDNIISKENDKLNKLDPTLSNSAMMMKRAQDRVARAEAKWRSAGRKDLVEAIEAKLEQYSRGGMPLYLSRLRRRLEDNLLVASVTQDAADVNAVLEKAYYTALRPNGILDAASLMKVSISNSQREAFMRFENSRTSGGANLPIPKTPLGVGIKREKSDGETEREFLTQDYTITFEIVQAFIDRPWFDLSFLQSPAYTTFHPQTGEALDPINQILTFSDGQVPPVNGRLRAIPVSAYFVRNMKIQSKAFMSLSDSERESVTTGGELNFAGFPFAKIAEIERETAEGESSSARFSSDGTLEMTGTFLIALASRYLEKAPNPDFDAFGKENWI